MAAINDVQRYIERRQMQQEEANAVAPAPNTPHSVTPSSAIDAGAPAVTQPATQPVSKAVDPVIPDLAVTPGSPTSPMDKKPVSAPINDLKNERIPYKNATEMHDAVVPRMRSQMIQNLSEGDAMKQGNISPAEYWSEQVKKAEDEGRSLNTYEALSAFMRREDGETPQEKAKRERRELISHTISGLGNVIANAANLAFATKGAVPIDLNSGMRELDERRQRIKAKRDALKEKQDSILMNAKMSDFQYGRSLEAAKAKAAAERAEKIEQRAFELQKQNANLSAQAARDKARMEFDGKHKGAALAENSRHNKAMEGIGWKNANTDAERAKQAKKKSSKDEKFDYVIVDNKSIPIPKDESKAVFSTLYQVMKRDPKIKGDAMESIEIKYGEGGDSDSKMMNTVRRRIGDSPAAIKYLQELLGLNSPEPETRQPHTPFLTQWGGLNWGNQKENNNETDW